MSGDRPSQVTQLLGRIRSGEKDAQARLFEIVADEMRQTAGRLMRQERTGHTLQPTALVNEAIVRLLEGDVLQQTQERSYLFGAAIRAMRQILIDHARQKKSRKRGGDLQRQPLDSAVAQFEQQQGFNLEALDRAINELEATNPRQRQIVEHRFFGGMTVEQTAEMLDVSVETVERDWRFARAWLYR